jgi:hypothetical protein
MRRRIAITGWPGRIFSLERLLAVVVAVGHGDVPGDTVARIPFDTEITWF